MRDETPREPMGSALGEVAPRPAEEVLQRTSSPTERPRATTRPPGPARRKGLRGFVRALGPGLISGGADDDPSAIGTFAQVGSQFGYGLLWVPLLTFPLMLAVQEMCARIALQTGVGLGVALRRRFPRWLVAACVVALATSNTLTLGADLGAVASGVHLLSREHVEASWVVVPLAVFILGLQLVLRYETIFLIFKWLALPLLAYVLSGFLAHPDVARVLVASVVPHLELSKDFLLGLAAVFGTAFSPYIFFWQGSMEVSELERADRVEGGARGARAGPQDLASARLDVFTGILLAQVVTYFIIMASGATLHAHGAAGIETAAEAAVALGPIAGPFASVLFSLGLIGSGLLAIPVLSGSAACALRESLGITETLASRPRHQAVFYGMLATATLVGLSLNLIHIDLIGALVVASAVSGVVAAPLIALVTLVAADVRIMGRRASGSLSRVLGWTAAAAMGVIAIAWAASPLYGT